MITWPTKDLEERVLRALFKAAADAGFVLKSADDGGWTHKVSTVEEMLEVVFSVDESAVRFKHPQYGTHVAVIVLGNDGWDCIADCSTGPGWDEVIKTVEDQFEMES